MSTAKLPDSQALLGIGEVRHQRLRPVAHGFAYPSFFLLLPMRTLRRQPCTALPRNRFGLIAFHDRDHGDGGADSLAWVEGLLAREGLLAQADGEVWLHCLPRVLGYAFKPVSFWYAHSAGGALVAVVAEVHNTFGERHCYVLHGEPCERPQGRAAPSPPPEGVKETWGGPAFPCDTLPWGRELQARKQLHVSPFCEVTGGYRFRFLRNDLGPRPAAQPRTVVRIEHDDADGLLLRTSVSGALQPLTRAALLAVFCRMPLLTLGVTARIHWQALLLWRKRVPFFRKPEAPAAVASRGAPWPDPGARP
ncbi:DUF1365 domain-containing protein [Ideonella azotifigens]|uniref:DUF1365 domain-containing protein n=1 Tax=Ideonella azotifigens TaxID=513160 RepID=A0ABP3UW50_9BURK|nr:DUF1365 domain-containing protein [Ideonella azotifigens]MCD2339730.1 DUF1365 domain-containing protein [Ideonella azotifigens]